MYITHGRVIYTFFLLFILKKQELWVNYTSMDCTQ